MWGIVDKSGDISVQLGIIDRREWSLILLTNSANIREISDQIREH